MSWYKKAKRTIPIPDEIYPQIDAVCDAIYDYVISNNKKKDYPGVMEFTNPYDNTLEKIPVVIFPKKNEDVPYIAFNMSSRILIVCPYEIINHYQIDLNDRVFFNDIFKNYISHEVVHMIDPRVKTHRNIDKNYYCNKKELEAYSKQISERIRLNFTKELKDDILSWLQGDINNVPELLKDFRHVINGWKNCIYYMKIFKQKIITDLLIMEKNMAFVKNIGTQEEKDKIISMALVDKNCISSHPVISSPGWYKKAKSETFEDRNKLNERIRFFQKAVETLAYLKKYVVQNAPHAKKVLKQLHDDKIMSSFPEYKKLLEIGDNVALDNYKKFAEVCEEVLKKFVFKVKDLEKERTKITDNIAKKVKENNDRK